MFDSHYLWVFWEYGDEDRREKGQGDPDPLKDPLISVFRRNPSPLSIQARLHVRIERITEAEGLLSSRASLLHRRRLEAYTKTLTTQVIELQYADDCAIMTHNRESMHRALEVISGIYSSLGLQINTQTEIFVQPIVPPNISTQLYINGDPIKTVNQFKYLGTTLTLTCSLDIEIQTRINLASAAFGRISTQPQLEENASVIIGTCERRHIVSFKFIYDAIGPHIAENLPGFHTFTGSDCTGKFASKGKKTYSEVFSPLEHGWKIENDCFMPVILDLPPAPEAITKLVKCGCGVNKCGSLSCSCIKNNMACTEMCNCQADDEKESVFYTEEFNGFTHADALVSYHHVFSFVSDDLGYVIYSALGSFYIPSCIMIFVYIRIYYAAKARARRGVPKKKPAASGAGRQVAGKQPAKKQLSNKPMNNPPNTTTTSFSKPPTPTPVLSTDDSRNGANERSGLLNKKVLICDVRVHEEVSPSRCATPTDNLEDDTPLRTVSEQVDADHRNHNTKSENGLYIGPLGSDNPDLTIGLPTPAVPPTPMREPNGGNMAVNVASPAGSLRRGVPAPVMDGDQMSDIDPSSSDSGVVTRCSVVKPLKLRFCHPLLGKKLTKPKRELIDMGRVSTPKARDPEKEKRRLARKKEKRATLILGLIMGSFIACWFPFFFMYILGPLCPACYIPVYAFDLAFWLGYMNSAFNPVIYTIFNKDFRRAFRKILFK
ncbi:uncharacterized protein LOC121869138 [Homarus americanus]|uniref:uncharacterized protein LOC121869138 n=1 Tax=Homarus americanus TaxID=6706 RepID=UPI001C44F94B|nr:uncharacterized protein LOC121869138 [Homarus americanus]